MPAYSSRSAEQRICNSMWRSLAICSVLHACALHLVPVVQEQCVLACAGLSFQQIGCLVSCRTLRTMTPADLQAALPCACMRLTWTCTSGASCTLAAVSPSRNWRPCSATETSWLLWAGHLCLASLMVTCKYVRRTTKSATAHLQVRCAHTCTASTATQLGFENPTFDSSCKHKLSCRCAAWT
jgi:hypothetical protein